MHARKSSSRSSAGRLSVSMKKQSAAGQCNDNNDVIVRELIYLAALIVLKDA